MKLTPFISTLLLPFTLLMAGQSLADNSRGFFAGVGVSAINVDDSVSFDKANLWAAEVVGGYKFNNWLGAELRYSTGLGEEEVYESPVADKMDIDNAVSVYYRAESVNQTGRFYALLGYTDLEYLQVKGGNEWTETEGDFSWGLGAGFIIAPKVNLNFEYRSLIHVQDQRFTAITTSLDYRF